VSPERPRCSPCMRTYAPSNECDAERSPTRIADGTDSWGKGSPTSGVAIPSPRDIRSSWRTADTAVAGVPRWARLAAYAIPLTLLPSSLWRIAAYTFHAPIADGPTHAPSRLRGVPLELYVVLLSIVSELAAVISVGLIATWGEVVPRRVPGLGGRAAPMRPAVIAGAAGAAVLTLLWAWVAVHFALGQRIDGTPQSAIAPLNLHDWRGVLAVAAYAPLVLWGPLLAAATIAYYHSRGR
jgi:hypothetical protein